MTIVNLTEKDKKAIRYQFRPALMMMTFLFFGISIFNLVIYLSKENIADYMLDILVYIDIGLMLFTFLVAYLFARKHLLDLKIGTKKIELKKIDKKEHQEDYEAGSATINYMPIKARAMKSFNSLSIIIDYVKYRVDEDFYMDCNEGDEVAFHYAAKSNYCIKMELVKNNRVNKMF